MPPDQSITKVRKMKGWLKLRLTLLKSPKRMVKKKTVTVTLVMVTLPLMPDIQSTKQVRIKTENLTAKIRNAKTSYVLN